MMEFTLSWKILRLVVRLETNIDVNLLITIYLQMQKMTAYHESPYMEELSGQEVLIPRSPDPEKNVGRKVETATGNDQKQKWVFGSTDIRYVKDFSLKVSCVFLLFKVPEEDFKAR